MGSGVDPQRGFHQREPELDIPPLQFEVVQFEATFLDSMMFESAYTMGPFSHPSFTKPHHTKTSPHQAPHAPNHALWMDLSTHISSLDTRMEELAVVSNTRFYSMEDHMDQEQATFEHLHQMIDGMESHQESQHKEMMTYLHSMFPPPPPQP